MAGGLFLRRLAPELLAEERLRRLTKVCLALEALAEPDRCVHLAQVEALALKRQQPTHAKDPSLTSLAADCSPPSLPVVYYTSSGLNDNLPPVVHPTGSSPPDNQHGIVNLGRTC